MVEEARLERLETGLAPVTEGWFVVSIPDAAWVTNEALGAACIFEGDDVSFADVGFTLLVLAPGQIGMYHREANQEDFLVLAGECLLLIEGEERRLTAWDFVHCPPGTEHIFVGAGNRPCVIFMTGGRRGWPEETGIVYTRSELALRHGAGVEVETGSAAEAYAPFPKWQPGPPGSWTGLPWG
jgi:uncharacterized cupin superfamily protein